ncbi:hypothetical protein FSP39_001185 [Pinctada imbricata]|uniref:Adenosine kinase n=1 Tax=Pinctada imbricata TaxID=66713 RepID=A0AA88Y234_PINIB|nr:hypothetical protein FSP39_001185 [Pinctada imbricata]
MRLTGVYWKQFVGNYWKRYVQRRMREVNGFDKYVPLIGWKVMRNKTWRYNQYRAWETMGQAYNSEEREFIPVEPIKKWSIFKGDREDKSGMSDITEGALLGIGNPLLDITVNGDQSLLDEFGLKSNNAIIAEEPHMPLFQKIVTEYEPFYLAGGATQNSIRVAQWMLQKRNATSFFGGVGNDMYRKILMEKAEEVGVNVRYETHPKLATGKCCAIITGEDRSLVTDLGAARHFTNDFLHQPENWSLVEKADCLYIGGFIVPVSSKAVVSVLKYAAANNKTVIMNLHATFLCKYFADPDLDLMRYIDVLFGNGDEASEFGKCMGFDFNSVSDICRKTVSLPKENSKKGRVVVFTQGRGPTVLGDGDDVREIPVHAVDKSLIKDTNGCGDAFVGGFLSQLVQKRSIDACLRAGSYAARTVIQYYGCNFPDKPDFE